MIIWSILFLGFILRIINLNQSLWLDEATQVLLSSDSIRNIIFERGADFHPPLSYILMHFWLFLGSTDASLRLLSVIFGVLTIWVVYKLSSEIFNKKVGILSAFLLSIAPYHIYYSQEIRMYSEATFFASVSMYYFLKIINEKKLTNSLLYILSTLALIYTHYDGFFLIFTQLIFLIFLKRELLSYFLKRYFFIFLFWLPWLPQFLIQLRGGANIDQYLPGWRSILSISFYKAIPLIFFKFSFGRIDFDNLILYLFIAFGVLSVFGYALYKGITKIKSIESRLIIFWLFTPIVIAFLISFKIPINQPFRVLFCLPAYYILLALGVSSLTKVKKILFLTLIAISFLGLSFYYFNSQYWREDWQGASKFVLDRSNLNNITIFAWPDPFAPYKYYVKQGDAIGVVKKFSASKSELENTLNIVDDKKEVYLFEYLQDLSDPKRLIQQILKDKGFRKVKVYDFRGVGFIDYFAKGVL